MTTIVYARGEIATDSRVVRHAQQVETEYNVFEEKVYTSPCGRLYLVKAGKGWTEDFYGQVVEAIVPQLIARKQNPNARVKLPEALTGFFDTLLVVTSESAYLLEGHKCRVLEGYDIACMGSGAYYVKAAVMAGKSVTEAVGITLRYDRMSGGKVNHYKAVDLKPLEELVSV